MTQSAFYAIGDVHGLSERLERLYDAILADIAETGVEAVIIHLGDYVDRGPDSRGVIDRVRALERHAEIFNASVTALLGNHERMMLDAFDETSDEAETFWLSNGGDETLRSYGVEPDDSEWRAAIDPIHLSWLRERPTLFLDPLMGLAFVHAGIEPAHYPNCGEGIYLWTRSQRFLNTESWPDRLEIRDLRVIHGHTPTEDQHPYVDDRRINVDTGAVFGGPLTCAILMEGELVRFLYA
jgi:serine/threonine protein phosphatase 1